MQPKDPNTAFVIELVGGFFGLLGLGYMYIGRTNEGLVRLVLWLLYVAVAWFVISLLSLVLVGICLIPIQLIVQVGIPIWSALALKNSLTQPLTTIDVGAMPQFTPPQQDVNDYASPPTYRPPRS